jgi:hypothetical protein
MRDVHQCRIVLARYAVTISRALTLSTGCMHRSQVKLVSFLWVGHQVRHSIEPAELS